MTKKELAQIVAEHMNKINKTVNIERTIKMLMKNMTTHELQACIRNYQK